MRSVKSLIAAGAASLLSSAAFAADMADRAAASDAMRRLRSSKTSAAGICAAISASATSGSSASTTRSTPSARRSSVQKPRLRHRGHLRPRRRLPVQQLVPRRHHRRISRQVRILRHRHLHVQARRRRRHLYTAQADGSFWQRLCRSRHLVVHHAVHRCRRRRRAGQDHQLHRHRDRPGVDGRCQPTSATTPRKWNFAWAAACRSRLQGHAELHGRTGLPLSRHGRRPDRRSAAPSTASTPSTTRRPSRRTSPRMTSSSACAGTWKARRSMRRAADAQRLIATSIR